MLYTISSDDIKAVFNSTGACLTSFKRISDGMELLWQGDEKIWSGQAPTLFPLIGRLKDSQFEADSSNYTIKNHGFARQTEFSAVQEGKGAVVFSMTSSDETRRMYPYDFILSIKYEVVGNMLMKSHTVKNLSGKAMYYEVGGHEGYNVALLPGEKMSDYYLQFKSTDTLYTHLTDKDVMISREKKALPVKDGRLYLNMELFKDDALIMENVPGSSILLGSDKSSAVLSVDFADMPYLGIWTKYLDKDTNYVCIEPWSSLPDCNYLDYKIENKHGIRRLNSEASETLTYNVTVY